MLLSNLILVRPTTGWSGLFIHAILHKLGFGHHWINLISQCLETVSYCVLHENKEIGPIHPKRGLRQGDPLSPYLFILLAEGLSAMLSNLERRGFIHGVSIARGAPKISHLFFADDSFIFLKANQSESASLKQTLDILWLGFGTNHKLPQVSRFFQHKCW